MNHPLDLHLVGEHGRFPATAQRIETATVEIQRRRCDVGVTRAGPLTARRELHRDDRPRAAESAGRLGSTGAGGRRFVMTRLLSRIPRRRAPRDTDAGADSARVTGGRTDPAEPEAAPGSATGEQATIIAAPAGATTAGTGPGPAAPPGTGPAATTPPGTGPAPTTPPGTGPAPTAPPGSGPAPAMGAGAEPAHAAPAGTDPAAPPRPGFRERSRLRRRLQHLRRVRELGFRDLGGLVFDQHRFHRPDETLVQAKVTALAALDAELRAIEHALRDERAITELREVGVSACARCGSLIGSDAGFCSACGAPVHGTPDLAAVVTAESSGAAEPQPPLASPPEAVADASGTTEPPAPVPSPPPTSDTAPAETMPGRAPDPADAPTTTTRGDGAAGTTATDVQHPS
jgi:hypothetical protein